MNLFVAYDHDGEQFTHEISLDLVNKTFQACMDNDVELLDDLSDQWLGWAITGSKEEVTNWLNLLNTNGVVSDTEELMCWAIGVDREQTIKAMLDEVEKQINQ